MLPISASVGFFLINPKPGHEFLFGQQGGYEKAVGKLFWDDWQSNATRVASRGRLPLSADFHKADFRPRPASRPRHGKESRRGAMPVKGIRQEEFVLHFSHSHRLLYWTEPAMSIRA